MRVMDVLGYRARGAGRRAGARRRRQRPPRDAGVLQRPALRRLRHRLRRADAEPFSFNSPLGACETCRGFGRVIGVDYGLVIPDDQQDAARRRGQAVADRELRECQATSQARAEAHGVPLDTPWRDLPRRARQWVIEGETGRGKWRTQWYGIRRFFAWLESKAYKMHIRVLLSRYRAYTPCTACDGARLKPDALLWRLGDADVPRARRSTPRFKPRGWLERQPSAPLGAAWAVDPRPDAAADRARARAFFERCDLPGRSTRRPTCCSTEIRARLPTCATSASAT
jgi:excinuclease ABC subunit A